MVKIRKDNVILKVEENKLQSYLNNGFYIVELPENDVKIAEPKKAIKKVIVEPKGKK